MIRGRMPVWRSISASSSPPFSASRVALVAAARISSTWCDRASRSNFDSACSAAVIASRVILRPSRPPAPSRTISFSRSITSKEKSGAHPDDDHVDRVGADVDGGETHGAVAAAAAIMSAFVAPGAAERRTVWHEPR